MTDNVDGDYSDGLHTDVPGTVYLVDGIYRPFSCMSKANLSWQFPRV